MKLLYTFRFFIVFIPVIFFNSCLKDTCRENFQLFIPVYKTLTEVRADMRSGPARNIENPGKIFTLGRYIFVNEINKGIHIINNNDPAKPKAISFIEIPGNIDMAVQNNTLYADSYSDLVAFDITNVTNITSKKIIPNVFPDRKFFYAYTSTSNPDSLRILVDYIVKDTTMDCSSFNTYYNCSSCASADAREFARANASISDAKSSGKAGSMARFALMSNHLYTVSMSDLRVFNLSQPLEPTLVNTQSIGWNIETIFPFMKKLFIGSTTGMFVYDASNPAAPALSGQFTHVRSCDPVIADEKYAYVTLRSGTLCGGAQNQLDILNIQYPNPSLVKTYALTNPHGLGKEGDILFVCDGTDGVKVYDVADVNNLKLIKHIKGIDSYDVITNGTIALIIAKDGLYQFDFSSKDNIKLLSKINTAGN